MGVGKWIVLVAASACLSLEVGEAFPVDPAPPCDLEPFQLVTPSPPLGPCPSQNIELVPGPAVPYVADAVEEVLVPSVAGAYEAPCQKPLPLPAPLSFALPTPYFHSPIYSFLSQAQNADPATALNVIAKSLSTALPPHLQLAAAVPAAPQTAAPCAAPAPAPAPASYSPPAPASYAPPAPCASPAPVSTPVTYYSSPQASPVVDIQTLLNLGLLQPTMQPSAVPLDASTLLNFGATHSTAAYPVDTSSVTLAALQPANIGLTQLTPEILAQLTLSGVPAGATTSYNVAPVQSTYLPGAVSAGLAYPATAPAVEAPCDETSKIGLVKNAWSKLYDPLRRLRTHSFKA